MGDEGLYAAPPPPTGRPGLRTAVRVVGAFCVVAGLALLSWVFYAGYATNWVSGRKQAEAEAQLVQRWDEPEPRPSDFQPGEGIAKLHIPDLGAELVVLEGTDADTLAAGPGHYPATALPGQPGNFAVAGHRNGYGAPFNELDELTPCAPLIVETATHWYVYRVLPLADSDTSGDDPKCAPQLPAPYDEVVGVRTVPPDQAAVLNPVPGEPEQVLPADQQLPLITLTTCHPEWSARQRLIVHGLLTKQYQKLPDQPGLRPPELTENAVPER